MNMNNRDPRNVLYDREPYDDQIVVARTPRRRSQPSLDVHPYGQRPSTCTGNTIMSAGHAASYGRQYAEHHSYPQASMPAQPHSLPTPPFSWRHQQPQQCQMAATEEAMRQQQQQQQQQPMPYGLYMNQFQDMAYVPSVLTHDSQLPTIEDFQQLLNEYITSLSEKKRDKALIGLTRYQNIHAVLKDPKCTTIESAQFRFWAKKMFTMEVFPDGHSQVLHEGKPVAIKEELFQILTNAHVQCQHGGRDKTSSQVRKYYSWVPKELIARFVRGCPSCKARKSRSTPPRLSPARMTPPRTPTRTRASASPSHTIYEQPVEQVGQHQQQQTQVIVVGNSPPGSHRQPVQQLCSQAGPQLGNPQNFQLQTPPPLPMNNAVFWG